MDDTTASDTVNSKTLQVDLESRLKQLKVVCVDHFGLEPRGESRAAQISYFFKCLTTPVEGTDSTLLGSIAYNEILHKGSAQGIVAFCTSIFGLSGNDAYRLTQLIAEERDDLKEVEGIANGKKQPKKKYADYVELIDQMFSPRRCILREELMTKDERLGKWVPVINRLGMLKSYCRDRDAQGWSATAADDHLAAYSAIRPVESLLDNIEWDGRDRVKELSHALVCLNFDQQQVETLVKDWGAKMMRRINDPRVRNRLLCLRGPQNTGKDWWIDALVGGFIPVGYHKNLSLRDDREVMLMLHSAVIFYISEFDKTARIESSFLKDIIDRPASDERLKHDKRDERRICRASFIASANPKDLLRDDTGNTRYIIFDVEKINHDYPGHNNDPDREAHRAQVLAQFSHLATCGFKSDLDTEELLKQQIELLTPESDSEAICKSFAYHMRKLYSDKIDSQNRVLKDNAYDAIALVSHQEKLAARRVSGVLRSAGLETKVSGKRCWIVPE